MDMDSLHQFAAMIQGAWGGQTLATLRNDAAKQFNGTCTNSLRMMNGPRTGLLICVTGEYELAKIVNRVVPDTSNLFNDWSIVSLTAAAGHAIKEGGFCCIAERDKTRRIIALVLAAGSPESIRYLENIFGLAP